MFTSLIPASLTRWLEARTMVTRLVLCINQANIQQWFFLFYKQFTFATAVADHLFTLSIEVKSIQAGSILFCSVWFIFPPSKM